MSEENLTVPEVESWLREVDPQRLDRLWRHANWVRRRYVGEAIHLRGLVEISNYCILQCHYCGLRSANRKLTRYRMKPAEILACARQAKRFDYGTVVLQSGEDPAWTKEAVAELVRMIREETGLAITLSLGERDVDEYRGWRKAGANRVLLRFETGDLQLYERIHPQKAGQRLSRMELLARLREMGYEIGSGVMIGIPGQNFDSLARDLERFRDFDLDMIGVGPFVPNPDTPLGQGLSTDAEAKQVPASVEMSMKVIALTRILRPDANIPSTSAIAALDPDLGHRQGLCRGANVIMPDLTPWPYREQYAIYPGKARADDPVSEVHGSVMKLLVELGRPVGQGAGSRRKRVGVDSI